MIFDFVVGGTGDEATVRGNRAAFDRWRFLPQMLRGIPEVSTATSILGQEIALPVLIAPTSLQRLCQDEGEQATARAARDAGTIYTMSTAASIAIEDIAPHAGPWRRSRRAPRPGTAASRVRARLASLRAGQLAAVDRSLIVPAEFALRS